jgi:hypothetical protein
LWRLRLRAPDALPRLPILERKRRQRSRLILTITKKFIDAFPAPRSDALQATLVAYASFAVDSGLYPDLGYGELTLSLINMGTRNYHLSVRVDKQPTGSRLTIRSGNTLAAERYTSLVLGWASGDQNCPVV